MPAPSDSDKGRVTFTCFDCQPEAFFSSGCLAFHTILNLVVGVILVVYVPSHTVEQSASSATSSLFWSSAIVGAPFVLIFILLKLYLTIPIDISAPGGSHDVVYASITFLLLVFLLTVELIVAIVRSKRGGIAVPRCMGYCCSLSCCCCFCCCCRPGGRSHSRVARALALWFIMACFQLIAASAVPVTIIVLTTSPLLMLAILSMVVSTFFGMVVFLAVLVHMCSQHDRSKRWILFIYSIILVGVLAMVCIAIFFLSVITEHGGQVNSVGGFIGTLVPSAILSIITWFVKVKVLGKKPTEADPSSERPERLQEEWTQDESTALL